MASLVDLLPTYAFADLAGNGTFVPITQANVGVKSALLLDLNGGSGCESLCNATTGVVSAIYSGEVKYFGSYRDQGGLPTSVGSEERDSSVRKLLGNIPTTGQAWFGEVESVSGGPEGDGIVPTASAVGLLSSDWATKISAGKLKIISLPQTDAGGAVDHNALTNNVLAQQKILNELTGSVPQVEDVSISAEFASLNAALGLIRLGLVDPLNYAKEAFEKLKGVLTDMGAGAQTALNRT